MTSISNQSGFLRFPLLVTILCLSLSLLVGFLPSASASPGKVTVHVYGSKGCSSCERIKEKLVDIYGSGSVVYHSLSDEPNALYFRKIFSEVLPGEEREVPLAGVIRRGHLVAVVGGYEEKYLSRDFWRAVDASPPVAYYGGENHRIKNSAYVRRLILQKIKPGRPSFGNLVDPVAVAAAADAVNPCAFSLFIVFLTFLTIRLNRGILKAGFSFILGVFAVYFFIGLGLRQCFAAFSFLRYGAAFFGVFVGVLQMSNLFLDHGVTLTPDAFKGRIREELDGSSDPACRICGAGRARESRENSLSEKSNCLGL